MRLQSSAHRPVPGLTWPPRCRRQQLRTTAGAGEAGAAGSPSSGLDALHDAVERGDLRGVQAAIEQLQHPEQELDTLVVRGNGIPQAAIHRAAQGGKETCMKVRRARLALVGWLQQAACCCELLPPSLHVTPSGPLNASPC